MKSLVLLIALFVVGTAAAQAPQTASGPATTAAAARRYETIAEKTLPGMRALRPGDLPTAKLRKQLGPKAVAKALPNQRPVVADFDGDGHRDFALVMKTRHAHSIFAFYIVACLWRKAGYDCRRISHPHARENGFAWYHLEVADMTNDSRCWGARKKRTWKAPTLILEPFLGNIVTFYPYDKPRDRFRRCDMGD